MTTMTSRACAVITYLSSVWTCYLIQVMLTLSPTFHWEDPTVDHLVPQCRLTVLLWGLNVTFVLALPPSYIALPFALFWFLFHFIIYLLSLIHFRLPAPFIGCMANSPTPFLQAVHVIRGCIPLGNLFIQSLGGNALWYT